MVCRRYTTKNKDLILPVNVLEKEKDKKRIWRNKVNQELKTNYKKIFNLINKNIFLNVPNFITFINGGYYKKKINFEN